MNNQHSHPGVDPTFYNEIALVFPDTGEVKRFVYEYYAASAGQPETTVHLPSTVVQIGGRPLFPLDYADDTLKLLNGLHDDASKRNDIIQYIRENRRISVFAYGSLLWNPINHLDEFIPDCTLLKYRKGFFCEDFIYRGTTYFTGLTMGLQHDIHGTVNGALLIARNENIIPFIQSFVKRETPVNFNGTTMNIYVYDFVKILLPDRLNFEYAFTCVVNTKSTFYLNKQLTIEEQAYKIGQAYGVNGTNFQYLEKLTNIYRHLKINDSFTTDFDCLYKQILSFRQSLSINDQKWLQIYDELQTLEERNEARKVQTSRKFEQILQPYVYRSIHLQEQNRRLDQRTVM